MIYTSGTTGLPKGIRREPATPEQIALMAERSRVALGIAPGMRALIVRAALSLGAGWVRGADGAERRAPGHRAEVSTPSGPCS